LQKTKASVEIGAMARENRKSISTNVTADEYELILAAAAERKMTISRFLLEILSVYLNHSFLERRPWGGDRAWSKSPEVNARVVRKMNAVRLANKAKRKAEEQKEEKK